MPAEFHQLIVGLVLVVPAFLLAVSFHEFSHALAATLLGDQTAARQGRLSLNPLRHIDPLGVLFLIIFRIGWARPVEFDHRNFRHPRLYTVLTGLAGPAANIFLALVLMYVHKVLLLLPLTPAAVHTVKQVFEVAAYINVMLGVFNLLPLPPLDGSHIVHIMIPQRYQYYYFVFQQYSFFVLLFVLMLPATQRLLFLAIHSTYQFLKHIVF